MHRIIYSQLDFILSSEGDYKSFPLGVIAEWFNKEYEFWEIALCARRSITDEEHYLIGGRGRDLIPDPAEFMLLCIEHFFKIVGKRQKDNILYRFLTEHYIGWSAIQPLWVYDYFLSENANPEEIFKTISSGVEQPSTNFVWFREPA